MRALKQANEKVNKPTFLLVAIFWALIGIFGLIATMIAMPAFRKFIQDLNMGFWFIIVSGISFFLLGIALIVLTLKQKVRGILRKFLILTGATSAGFFVSVLLHNFIYGLFIVLFGPGFWERIGLGDEPFFFLLAIVVCPIGFLIGVVGSVTLFIKRRRGRI